MLAGARILLYDGAVLNPRSFCETLTALVVLLLAGACGEPRATTEQPDASQSVDASSDQPFSLPLYRIGSRNGLQGSFVQNPISGTIELPIGAGISSFADWTFVGHGIESGPADSVSAPRRVGDRTVADITITG